MRAGRRCIRGRDGDVRARRCSGNSGKGTLCGAENPVIREDYEGRRAAAADAAEALVELFSGGREADVDA